MPDGLEDPRSKGLREGVGLHFAAAFIISQALGDFKGGEVWNKSDDGSIGHTNPSWCPKV